ncbi:MAG: hypothetical protein OEZ59_12890, partial [Deltaproteobacteria bacterium]|nr:hypothetical protein [Deltaproteobacteria bacterium]
MLIINGATISKDIAGAGAERRGRGALSPPGLLLWAGEGTPYRNGIEERHRGTAWWNGMVGT